MNFFRTHKLLLTLKKAREKLTAVEKRKKSGNKEMELFFNLYLKKKPLFITTLLVRNKDILQPPPLEK